MQDAALPTPPESPPHKSSPLVLLLIFGGLGVLYWCAYPSKIVGAAHYDTYYAVWYSVVSPLSGLTFAFAWSKDPELAFKASLASIALGFIIGGLAMHKNKKRPFLRGMVGTVAPLPMLVGWIPSAALVGFLFVASCVTEGARTPVSVAVSEINLSELSTRLKTHVVKLADEIGERSAFSSPQALARSADYIRGELRALEYEVLSQAFKAGGVDVENLEVVLPGTSLADESIVVGAHYDSSLGTPAANDNGSGVAALIELARALRGRNFDRAVRLVAFTTEEPPFYRTKEMGSFQYAARLKERGEKVVAMLSLETMGYYSDEPGSQRYPPGVDAFYPDTGDFIAFVGNVGSLPLVRKCSGLFAGATVFPVEGAALPGFLPGIGWSDHWSFWEHGYDAVMVTDTAPFRYFDYHESSDTPEKLDYPRLAQVVGALQSVITGLATADPRKKAG